MMRNLWCYLALLLLAGCATNAPNACILDAQGGDPQLVINNGGLQATCEITGGRVLYEGDIMVGIVNLVSHVDEQRSYHMRWRWYDADNLQITTGEGQQNWRTQWVDALDAPQIQGRAPTPGAVRGEFQIRWVNAQ